MFSPISGIIAPIVTPFLPDEQVDLRGLKKNIRAYAKTSLSGYFMLGTNGESRCLSEVEKLKIIEAVLQEKSPEQVLIVGTGYESTFLTISFTCEVAKLGINYASVIPPSYYKKHLTDEALLSYYHEIADVSPIPVMIYNAPGYIGTTISTNLLTALSEHPNIAGLKDSSPGQIFQYLVSCKENFAILSGTVNTLLPALLLGASGGVVSLANIFPDLCTELLEIQRKGELTKALPLHTRLVQLNKAISGSFGVAGVKYAMDVIGYVGGLPRRPLLPLKEYEMEKIKKAIFELQT
jgi:4-hydroxy-2-oxoglutarate aldolase